MPAVHELAGDVGQPGGPASGAHGGQVAQGGQVQQPGQREGGSDPAVGGQTDRMGSRPVHLIDDAGGAT